MLSNSDQQQAILSIGQRRIPNVQVQKPQQSVQQQMTIDASVSPGPSQMQASPNPSQNVTQPQQSPQQVFCDILR
jgi:hypothetical protein